MKIILAKKYCKIPKMSIYYRKGGNIMRVSTTVFQNTFGKYLKKVIGGEQVIITKNDCGVAYLVPYSDPLAYILKEGNADYYIQKKVTYEEFLEVTRNADVRYELIDGEIFLMSSPTHQHQIAVREIFVQLYNYFVDRECSPLTSPFDVRLKNDALTFEEDPNVVQPDILVICDEETIDENGRYHGVPSLIVEVLSPSTRSRDMVKKLSLYMLSGVSEYWVVDLVNQSIIIYELVDCDVQCIDVVKFGELLRSRSFKGLEVDTGFVKNTLH